MSRVARHLRCPEDVLGWIPWYSDGSLSARERGAVEAHAAECADCRAEIDMIAGAPFEIDADLPDPDRVFAEIEARIAMHAEERADDSAGSMEIAGDAVRRGASSRGVDARGLSRIAGWVRGDAPAAALSGDAARAEPATARARLIQGPWSQRPAFRAAAAVLLLSLGAIAGSMYAGSNGAGNATDIYESATAAPTPASAGAPKADVATQAAATPMLDVVFRESATAAEIAKLLREVGGEIVSGPTRMGVYRVRLAARSDAGAQARAEGGMDLDGVRARFKSPDGGVALFAEVVP